MDTPLFLNDRRQQISANVEPIITVRALADVIASYIGAEDLVCDWLREHGPIVYVDDDYIEVVIYERDGNVLASDDDPRHCHVSILGSIETGTHIIALCKGSETRYKLYTSDRVLVANCSCTSTISVSGESVLLSATLTPVDLGTLTQITVSFQDGMVDTHQNVVVTDKWIRCSFPDVAELEAFAELLETYEFAGMERCWTDRSIEQEGIVRFNGRVTRPRLHWTEASPAGASMRKTRALEPDEISALEPMFPIMRRQRVGIQYGRKYMNTLVDERTEHIISPILHGRRKRKQVARFSPM
jgi:hypothetical protein